ncbi:C-C motif chemokine 2 isoform X2 [Salmo salar]|uniref:C-C motif chemokine 2 isoform X2 n=1 Tax=Salmo salar TaxID=8030 RepID=A0A1S3R4I9_SALSA|nr:C-C motif chemokine 2 isoform X2 [Salmo salar]|eukprot:XP_014047280.1 PREDICTED: C-C motif chemokine 2-like isoform X2 [Salmo salar]
MRLSLVFSSLLCVATWMTGVDASFGPVNTCCLKMTQKRISPKKVVDYTVQTTALCPIKVIVLHTIERKKICGDPGSDWVRKAMGKVDETKTIKREEEEGKEGKTVTMAPAVPHKQRKGQKKGAKKGKGKGGKRGGKREGRGRKRTGVTNQLSN